MSDDVIPTNPEQESAQGRIALWLDSDDLRWLRQHRWWLWWGAAILAVYVLSIGPAWRWALSADSQTETGQRLRTLNAAYAPVYWLKYRFELPGHVIDWYTSKWDPPRPEIHRCYLPPGGR